ncbi:hypothetical protein GPJ56_011072 [Histomonas meleagridis]|uniref:uncharacterized protein n=1 Tax=Histomonas meleagridis TaxID=135588 RepID=UPI00355AAA75|nr:hypothetical protein GPJ56_011072 [Histomonas meleagridis]KAH0800849.1 hypothetical protein GO595_006602 [Histomonas meleagridis]
MEDKQRIAQFHEMFPNKDVSIISELIKECRDDEEIIERLQNQDSSTTWKKSKAKNAPQENDQRRKREQKPRPKIIKKEEKIRKITSKPKPVIFGQPSKASWGDIQVIDNEIVTPEPPAEEQPQILSRPREIPLPSQVVPSPSEPKPINDLKPKYQPKTQHQPQPQTEQPLKQEEKPVQQAPPVLPPVEPVPVPSNETSKPKPRPTRLASTVLYLPTDISEVVPNYSKFGTFDGPIPKPAPIQKPVPQIADKSNSFEEIEKPKPQAPIKDEKETDRPQPQPQQQQQQPILVQPQPTVFPQYVFQQMPSEFQGTPFVYFTPYQQSQGQSGQNNNNQRPMAFKSVNEEQGMQQQQFVWQPVYGMPQSFPQIVPQGPMFIPYPAGQFPNQRK